MTAPSDETPRRHRNREALVQTIRRTERAVRRLWWVTLGLMLLSGVIGGFAKMAASSDPGWGSVFFLAGAGRTLLFAVPACVLLYVGGTLVAGLVVFLRIRLGTAR